MLFPSGTTKNPIRGFRKQSDDLVGIFRPSFRVPVVDEHRCASCVSPFLHVSPPVTDQKGCRKVQPKIGSGLEEHAGRRFPAGATGCIIVVADPKFLDGEVPAKNLMDRFHLFSRLPSPRQVGLVRDHYKPKPCCLQPERRFRHTRENLQFPRPDGGYGLPSRTEARFITPSRSRNTARWVISPTPISSVQPSAPGAKPTGGR